MGRKKLWGDVENTYIVEHAATKKDAELAYGLEVLTGRKVSVQGVRKQRQKLGVVKVAGRGMCKLRPTQTNLVEPVATPVVADVVVKDSSCCGGGCKVEVTELEGVQINGTS